MKLVINNEEYCVSWRHNNNVGIVDNRNRPIRSSTECFITISGGGVVTGRAILHENDKNYNKQKGKKASFERAVKCILDREIRTTLWKAYWDSYNPQKPDICFEISEDQLSMLNTIADIEDRADGQRYYTVNRSTFTVKIRRNDNSKSDS